METTIRTSEYCYTFSWYGQQAQIKGIQRGNAKKRKWEKIESED